MEAVFVAFRQLAFTGAVVFSVKGEIKENDTMNRVLIFRSIGFATGYIVGGLGTLMVLIFDDELSAQPAVELLIFGLVFGFLFAIIGLVLADKIRELKES